MHISSSAHQHIMEGRVHASPALLPMLYAVQPMAGLPVRVAVCADRGRVEVRKKMAATWLRGWAARPIYHGFRERVDGSKWIDRSVKLTSEGKMINVSRVRIHS